MIRNNDNMGLLKAVTRQARVDLDLFFLALREIRKIKKYMDKIDADTLAYIDNDGLLRGMDISEIEQAEDIIHSIAIYGEDNNMDV